MVEPSARSRGLARFGEIDRGVVELRNAVIVAKIITNHIGPDFNPQAGVGLELVVLVVFRTQKFQRFVLLLPF